MTEQPTSDVHVPMAHHIHQDLYESCDEEETQGDAQDSYGGDRTADERYQRDQGKNDETFHLEAHRYHL